MIIFEKKRKKGVSVIYLPSGVRDTHLHRIARDLCATFSPPTPRSEPLRSTPAMSTCRAPQRHFRVRFCGVPPENSGAPSWTAAPELSHVALGARSSYQLYLSPSALSPGGLLGVSLPTCRYEHASSSRFSLRLRESFTHQLHESAPDHVGCGVSPCSSLYFLCDDVL